MLLFLEQNLVYFAIPKTGSTAFETALADHCSLNYRDPPEYRHMNVRRYDFSFGKHVAREHKTYPERMAILRHPLDRVRSWYKYGRAADQIDTENSTKNITFTQYVRDIIAGKPVAAGVGDQNYFCSDQKGNLAIDHLFAIEKPMPLLAFVKERLWQDVVLPQVNVSPEIDTSIDPAVAQEFVVARPEEFRLYYQVLEAGHLKIDVDRSYSGIEKQRAAKAASNSAN